jgi:hypothetical protein
MENRFIRGTVVAENLINHACRAVAAFLAKSGDF